MVSCKLTYATKKSIYYDSDQRLMTNWLAIICVHGLFSNKGVCCASWKVICASCNSYLGLTSGGLQFSVEVGVMHSKLLGVGWFLAETLIFGN